MRIGVLGTGMVGRAIAGKLSELGHEVVVGTRDPGGTLARQEQDLYGNPPFPAWLAEHPRVRLDGLAEAAAHGELVVNATAGAASLEALRLAGEANLDGKVLDDPDAKALVTGLLTEGLGWRDVVDLGDITAARGAEMVMPLWLRPMGGLRTPMFNYKVVR